MDEKIVKYTKYLVAALSVFIIVFHLYTAIFGIIPGIGQRTIHLGTLVVILFLTWFGKEKRKWYLRVFDAGLILFAILGAWYVTEYNAEILNRSGVVFTRDIIFGLMMILVLLEGSRRVMGNALSISALIFIAYSFLGPYLPGLLHHTGYGIKKIINMVYLSTEGIWGTSIRASATYIIIFVIFGSVLQVTGAGDFFTRVANSKFGAYRGGPAKVAVVASGLFGSISGSCMANVVGTGTFTIPMMKKTGFEPEFAGAVEASASTGGQIMPPVMASVAFLIADNLGITYGQVAFAALLPALLYYAAIFFQVDFRAVKLGLKGLDKANLENTGELMRHSGYLFLPLVVLVIMLATGITVTKAGLYTIAATFIISFFRKESRITPKKFVSMCCDAARGGITVAVACGLVGVMMGTLTLTGLGFRLSNMLVSLSNGSVVLLLILCMVTSLIMGMGLPSLACYVLLATLVAPALIQMNIEPIAAHLFLFYFGIIGNVTPPVAGAAYCAAGLAQSNPMKTGIQAFLLSISGFLIPFVFAFNPALVMVGSVGNIIWTFVTAFFGVYCLSAAIERYLFWKLDILEDILMFVAAILMVDPNIPTDFAGFGIFAAVLIIHKIRNKKHLTPASS